MQHSGPGGIRPAATVAGVRRFLVLALLVAGCSGGHTASQPPVVPRQRIAPPGVLAIGVAGNRLVDGSGAPVRLLGVNRSGTEYACAQGWGIFDGPSNAASVAAIAKWHTNVVRVPLNEACWLDLKAQISPYNPAFTGKNYRDAIIRYVRLLNAHGLYAIVELHWNGGGGSLANWQHPMPDAENAPTFWTSVATLFRSDHAVLFDLFNEPNWNDWSCWQKGCTIWPGSSGAYQAAGMQQLVYAVRSAGASQPILLDGIHYSADLTGWLDHEPTDPKNALVASPHLYDNPCKTVDCFKSSDTYHSLGRIAKKVPVVFGELGENDCSDHFVVPVMQLADDQGFSYLGWAWNTSSCASFPSLITKYDGTPTAFGAGFRAHLAAVNP